MTDLLGGQVDSMFMDIAVLLPHVQAGRIRALAIGSPKRSSILPDVPTTAELGYPEVVRRQLVRHRGAPRSAKAHCGYTSCRSGRDARHARREGKACPAGRPAGGDSPDSFHAFLVAEIAKWAKVVKQANIKPE